MRHAPGPTSHPRSSLIPRLARAGLWVLIAAALLWLRARSRTHDDVAVFFTPAGNLQAVASGHGRIYFFISGWSLGPDRGLTVDFASQERDPPDDTVKSRADPDRFHDLLTGYADDHAGRWGFDWYAASRGPLSNAGVLFAAVAVPTWSLAAACALPPVLGLALAIRRRRTREPTACEHCGYDLRATPEANGPLLDRCPECGHAPSGRNQKPLAPIES